MISESLETLAERLATGQETSCSLVEACFDRMSVEGSGAGRTFIQVNWHRAFAEAKAMDRLRMEDSHPSRYAGIPISVKDLFDVAGEITRAGSQVFASRHPAERDAVAIRHLRQAGFVFVGRTNMTEFAYSGLGLNPHFGTPLSPYNRDIGHIPGGSSSGAAVSVADGFAMAAIGTDTGGSCRIPAAFCGVVGYKPTASRISRDGVVALSDSLDSVGPFAADVRSAQILDAIMAGDPIPEESRRPLSSFRFAVPTSLVLDGMDDAVAGAFAQATAALRAFGATVDEFSIPSLLDLPQINSKGGLVAAEAWHGHKPLLEARFDDYDPRVAGRMMNGSHQTADDYMTLLDERRRVIAEVSAMMEGYDAMLMPTVSITPPALAPLLDDDDHYMATNLQVLRNTSVINFIDGCALSLPIHDEGTAPVGLMIAGLSGADQTVFAASLAIERQLHGSG
ncbi:amidase [Coralliovum pocilloporae]|uniref:amidase n=1 Tax=Coralliovum pocilloporae TaxID=3066369 RepID=UPI003306ACCC